LRQAFAVGLMVAVPAAQGGVAGVGKKNRSVGDSTWPSQNTTLALPW